MIKWMDTGLMHDTMKHLAIKHKAFFNNFFDIKMTIQNYHILHNMNNDTPKIAFLIKILDGLKSLGKNIIFNYVLSLIKNKESITSNCELHTRR